MKLTELKQLVRECVREIKEEVSNSPEASGLLNGQSNQVAASRVNKLLSAISKGIFSDQSWEGVNKIFAKLKEAGIEFDLLGAKYGGHADSRDGMPTYKEWQISIPFTNNKGKQIDLVGQITAHGAGTVEDPLSRYDITAYVTPVAKRIREEWEPYDPETDTFAPGPRDRLDGEENDLRILEYPKAIIKQHDLDGQKRWFVYSSPDQNALIIGWGKSSNDAIHNAKTTAKYIKHGGVGHSGELK